MSLLITKGHGGIDFAGSISYNEANFLRIFPS